MCHYISIKISCFHVAFSRAELVIVICSKKQQIEHIININTTQFLPKILPLFSNTEKTENMLEFKFEKL